MLRQKKYNVELIHIADMVLIADYTLGVCLSTPQRRNIRILLRCVCKVVGGYMNIMHDKYDKDDCDYNDKKYEEYDNGKDENPLAWLLPE